MPAVPRQGLPHIDDSMKIEHVSKPNLRATRRSGAFPDDVDPFPSPLPGLTRLDPAIHPFRNRMDAGSSPRMTGESESTQWKML